MTVAVCAQTGEGRFEFNIHDATLAEALNRIVRDSDLVVLYPHALADRRDINPVIGRYTIEEAIEELFRGGAFSGGLEGGVIKIIAADREQPEAESDMAQGNIKKQLLAGAAAFLYGTGAYAQDVETIDDREDQAANDKQERDTIVVTGTNIRGAAPESSPFYTFDRDTLLQSGITSTEQFIRLLPQNFGGGASEFATAGLPTDPDSVANNSYGTGANLRGLGSGSTLILLNGNRLAPTSSRGGFVDLSMIPVSALERVDVLADGASSVYGADAVAGVINFIVRDDYDGAETSFRYGSVTSGNMDEFRISQTVGTAWESGNLLAVYEYYNRDNLTLAERPELAAPALTNGDIISDTSLHDLLPSQSRHSAIISASQRLGSSLEISASGLYSNRSSANTTFANIVPESYSDAIASSESLAFSGGAEYEISEDWYASVNATYNQIRNDRETVVSVRPDDPDSSEFDSDFWSVDFILNGELFDLPGGSVKIAVGGQYREETFSYAIADVGIQRNGKRDVTAVFGEAILPIVGSGNSMPGVDRLEINVSGRLDDYSDFGTTVNPKVGLLWSPTESLNLRGSYSESFAPPSLGYVGDLNRRGIIYPWAFFADLFDLGPQDPSVADVDMIIVTGTSANLKPETSRTFTAGFDYEEAVGRHSWSTNATYYDIRFEGRIGTTPIPGNQTGAIAPYFVLNDPSSLPEGSVVFFPTPDELSQLVDTLNEPVSLRFGATLENVGIINYATQARNIAITETRGIDFQVGYALETNFGKLSAGLNANYILDFTRQAAETTPEVETLNTLYNPVDLKLRGRLGISSGGFAGNLFVNHLAGYRTVGRQQPWDI